MATIINNPGGSEEGSGVGIIMAVVVAIAAIGLFIVFVMPSLRGAQAPSDGSINVDVNLPEGVGGPAEGAPQSN